jgi:hypothetical protein
MSEDDENSDSGSQGSSRSSISVSSRTKGRFDTLRRQLSAHEDEDMTGDGTLAHLLDYFESAHEWVSTDDGDDS